MKRLLIYTPASLIGFLSLGYQFIIIPFITPFYGSGLFVWAGVILSFMIAYTIGNFFSPILAGNKKGIIISPCLLTLFYLLLFVTSQSPLHYISSTFLPTTGLIVTCLVYCLIPTTILSSLFPTITSFISEHNKKDNTPHVLTSVSIANYLLGLGNMAGVAITVFLLIPYFDLLILFRVWFVISIILTFLLWNTYFKHSVKTPFYLITSILILIPSASSNQHKGIDYLYSKYTKDGWIGIADIDGNRLLLTRVGLTSPQSIMVLDDPTKPLGYIHDAFIVKRFLTPLNTLTIGLGGGSFQRAYNRQISADSKLTTIEINPLMIELSKEYFGYDVEEYENHKLIIGDGRIELNKLEDIYDYIFVDAYNADTIPTHMITTEWVSEVKSKLTQDGILASNLLESSNIFWSYVRTLQEHFNHIYLYRCSKDQYLAIATDKELPSTENLFHMDSEKLMERYQPLTDLKFTP